MTLGLPGEHALPGLSVLGDLANVGSGAAVETLNGTDLRFVLRGSLSCSSLGSRLGKTLSEACFSDDIGVRQAVIMLSI